MRIKWDRVNPYLEVEGRVFPCSCRVRNEENGLRKPSEIVYSMPDGLPYQPRVFPAGIWKVLRPQPRSEDWLKPWYIGTDAFQHLPVWEIRNGLYVQPTTKLLRDSGYGFHASMSLNTWGCCRLETRAAMEEFTALVFEAFQDKEIVMAEVI